MRKLSRTELRVLRFCIWALLMLATLQIVVRFAPERAAFVPCAFIPLIVPIVLMLFRRRKEQL